MEFRICLESTCPLLRIPKFCKSISKLIYSKFQFWKYYYSGIRIIIECQSREILLCLALFFDNSYRKLLIITVTIQDQICYSYIDLLDLDLGSRGPSTVTLIALAYVATWYGMVLIWIVRLNDFPVNTSENCCLKFGGYWKDLYEYRF